MVGKSSSVGNAATLNLILGVFLKLLGFFVVLYVYADIDPIKARQAEESLKERFNISVSLVPNTSGSDQEQGNAVMQMMGRSYQAIDTEMKTQIDFLSSEYQAHSHVLVLRVPAHIALDLDGMRAQSFEFADILIKTLQEQSGRNRYAVEAVAIGSEHDALMRSVSLFVQKMVARQYPPELLAVGFKEQNTKPMLELRITEVRS